MKKQEEKPSKMTLNQIKKKYPDKWVGLGDPEVENFTVKKAFVVCAGNDKRKMSKKMCHLMDTTPYELYRLEWTGTPIPSPVDFLVV